MASAVEAYMLAIQELESIEAEADRLASPVPSAAEMLDKGIEHWRIGPQPVRSSRDRRDTMYVDESDASYLDPQTWPTAEQFAQIIARYKVAKQQVQTAYNALSSLEKTAVQRPPKK